MRTRQCFGCTNLLSERVDGLACLAFPDGIPEVILTGEVDHSQAYPGDHGFRFTAADPADNFDDGVGEQATEGER